MEDSAIDLSSVDIQPSEYSKPLSNLLSEYIRSSQPSPSATTVAAQIDELSKSSENQGEDGGDSLNEFFWSLWDVFIRTAAAIPYQHPGQQKLVNVLEELARLPRRTVKVEYSEQTLWGSFPSLGIAAREELNMMPPDSLNSGFTKKEFSEWINFESFIARVLGARLMNWTYFPIWSLRSSLEEPVSLPEILNCYITASAQWLIHSGEILFSKISDTRTMDHNMARSLRPGSLFKGSPGYSIERWRFWEQQFRELSESLDPEAKLEVQKALQKMAELSETSI
ncbi:hypothetical protein TWF481_006759 [Arthrobotrys musiformis]|uniref:Uncharacterized protein n=1 Tax=Arthrobotrys musiformis TaxID=47236 RepID=A0AAV9W9J8_9PEZI